jgi:hypothetical protein
MLAVRSDSLILFSLDDKTAALWLYRLSQSAKYAARGQRFISFRMVALVTARFAMSARRAS